jgi:hypothetical protein
MEVMEIMDVGKMSSKVEGTIIFIDIQVNDGIIVIAVGSEVVPRSRRESAVCIFDHDNLSCRYLSLLLNLPFVSHDESTRGHF